MTELFNRLDFWISLVGVGLVLYLWGRRRWRAFIMSRNAPTVRRNDQVRYLDNYTESADERNSETTETPRPVAETENEKIHFAETAVADALARLILAGELDKTKAVKIGAGKKSGEGYQKWARLVAAAIERQKEPEFPTAESIRRPSIVEH